MAISISTDPKPSPDVNPNDFNSMAIVSGARFVPLVKNPENLIPFNECPFIGLIISPLSHEKRTFTEGLFPLIEAPLIVVLI